VRHLPNMCVICQICTLFTKRRSPVNSSHDKFLDFLKVFISFIGLPTDIAGRKNSNRIQKNVLASSKRKGESNRIN